MAYNLLGASVSAGCTSLQAKSITKILGRNTFLVLLVCAYNLLRKVRMIALLTKEIVMLTVNRPRSAAKRATNVSLPEDLLSEAKALQINISQAAEAGVAQAIARTRSERWLAENQEALESSNAFVEKHGLPLAKYRMF